MDYNLVAKEKEKVKYIEGAESKEKVKRDVILKDPHIYSK